MAKFAICPICQLYLSLFYSTTSLKFFHTEIDPSRPAKMNSFYPFAIKAGKETGFLPVLLWFLPTQKFILALLFRIKYAGNGFFSG